MRIENSIRNITTSLVGQFINIALNFITRSIFIKILGTEYLGINGLLTNIISILTLAEMGIGSAIVYSLYKPIAEKDNYKIKGLMNFYNSAYKLIAIVILLLGIGIIPGIPYIVKSNIEHAKIIIIYGLFLINAVSSYVYAYKKSIIIADQKDYILSIYRNIFKIILNIGQVTILIISKDYIMFLLMQISITLVENIVVAKKSNRMYPLLLEKDNIKLEVGERKEIIKNVKALLYHKIGGVIVNSTDNILISTFVGVRYVGIYSNYSLITGALNLIIGPAFSALTASIGNLNALETKEKSYKTYKLLLFINFWIAGFCSICLLILFNPFISVWIGEEYLFNNYIVLAIVINFYMLTIRRATLVYKDSFGLFWNDRYKPLIESVINVTISVTLAPKFGILGVFIGTFISTLLAPFWIEPYVLYKYGFELSIKDFFKLFIKYTAVILIAAIVTIFSCSFIRGFSWMKLILKIMLCLIIPNIIFTMFFYRQSEFNDIIVIIRKIFSKFTNKNEIKIG